LIASIALFGIVSSARAQQCERLARVQLAHVTIVAAELVAPGRFAMPGGTQNAPAEFFTAFDRLRAFCRVQAVARPTSDSDIGIEVWLPASGWNGRYLGVGNGGYGGSFNYYRLGESVNVGFVASSTDTGHRGTPRDTSWAVGHREKQIDFDHRAVHETAVVAKALTRAFYDSRPRRSYFSSCSNGGRQALMEAEQHPADYDGIFAGAPELSMGFTAHVTGRFDAFAKRGGKIIIYHGTRDRPDRTVAFFDSLARANGAASLGRFLQLYVVPGMEHCGSGDEPDDIGQWLRPSADRQHSLFQALEHWVEAGVAPTGVIATRFVRDGDATSGIAKTSVLCPYRPTLAGVERCVP
jgi:hypothetical protein